MKQAHCNIRNGTHGLQLWKIVPHCLVGTCIQHRLVGSIYGLRCSLIIFKLHDKCRACTCRLAGQFSGFISDLLIQVVPPFMKMIQLYEKSLFVFQLQRSIAALVSQTLQTLHAAPLTYRLLPYSHPTNITASSQLQEIDLLCSCFLGDFSYHVAFQLTAQVSPFLGEGVWVMQSTYGLANRPWA